MELRDEIGKMKEANQTPSDFGLKVRQDPDYSLLVTARNKMRNATPITRPVTVSGHLLETPRLKRGSAVLENNEAVFKRFVEDIAEVGAFSIERSQPYWRGIPKGLVSGLLRNFETSQWHLSFQGRALAEYIDDKMTDQPWDVTLCCKGEGKGLDCLLYTSFRIHDVVQPFPNTLPCRFSFIDVNGYDTSGCHGYSFQC